MQANTALHFFNKASRLFVKEKYYREYEPDQSNIEACSNSPLLLGVKAFKMTAALSQIPTAGLGLFTLRSIPQKICLGEYTGQILTNEDATFKSWINDWKGRNYLFGKQKHTIIDAELIGSYARFANNTKQALANSFFLLNYVTGVFRIGHFTSRMIRQDEEIVIHYGSEFATDPEYSDTL